MQDCPSPAFLADIQILSMFPSLLFTTSGFCWPAAKMLFINWWLGRPEDSLRDYLLPSCAANCSLCSLLLAPPQDSAVRKIGGYWKDCHSMSVKQGHGCLHWPFHALKSTPPLTDWDWVSVPTKDYGRSRMDKPPGKIITLCCNHNFSFQERSKELSIRRSTYLSNVKISASSKADWKQSGKPHRHWATSSNRRRGTALW